jgi:hypothetical protein
MMRVLVCLVLSVSMFCHAQQEKPMTLKGCSSGAAAVDA